MSPLRSSIPWHPLQVQHVVSGAKRSLKEPKDAAPLRVNLVQTLVKLCCTKERHLLECQFALKGNGRQTTTMKVAPKKFSSALVICSGT